MSEVYFTTEPSLFAYRKPLRHEALFALLDATAFEHLGATLKHAELDYISLFSNDDAVLLENEAPYLVALTRQTSAQWKPILRYAQRKNAGIALAAKSDLQTLRRHWKKWLSVTLPEQEKPVLFRFYDPRVLFAFIATLSPAEGAAFFGPVSDIGGFPQEQMTLISRTAANHNVAPRAFTAGSLYAITPTQIEALEEVVSDTFKERLKRYLRIVWWQYAEDLPEAELNEIVELGIADAERLGTDATLAVINMTLIRLIDPQLSTDDFYWQQANEHPQLPNAIARSHFLTAVMFADNFPRNRRTKELISYRRTLFGRGEEHWHDIPRNWE